MAQSANAFPSELARFVRPLTRRGERPVEAATSPGPLFSAGASRAADATAAAVVMEAWASLWIWLFAALW